LKLDDDESEWQKIENNRVVKIRREESLVGGHNTAIT
jgi:hypothetical protein